MTEATTRFNHPFRYPMKEFPMESPNHDKQAPKATPARKSAPRLQIVKLEPRIAPALTSNHNETLVREPAKTEHRPAVQKPKVRIAKLEQRIAPGYSLNHNETLVRDRSS